MVASPAGASPASASMTAAGSSFPVALLVAAACSLATLPLALMRTRRSVG